MKKSAGGPTGSIAVLMPLLATLLSSCGSGSDSSSGVTGVDASGDWSLVTTSSEQFDTAGGACLSGAGTLSVSGQSITGSFTGNGSANDVAGTIENGSVVAQFTRDGQTIGNVLGSFSSLSGSGTWADIFGCSGDWTATR
jgi:hypothetical protein